MFGLNKKQYSILQEVLKKYVDETQFKILIFGSRARGDFKPFSDIDICILDEKIKYPNPKLFELKEALYDSSLIYMVDVQAFSEIASKGFRQRVLNEGKNFFDKNQKLSDI
jgi:uncharacterized protein